MSPTATFGVAFLIVGLAAMFLMYRLWGYPFDKATRTSAAPRWAMFLHRALGYVFTAIYIGLMSQMLPRLWQYQVEFPARTTAHIIIGFTIGFLLIVKIAIMRFFRHLEEWMPALGTSIMGGTVILLGLSLPFFVQERALGRDALSETNRARVAELLPRAGLPEGTDIAELATPEALASGRAVLLGHCLRCHDLRTVLAKPRTPAGWFSTVERMAEKPVLFAPLTPEQMLEVTAYLVAITPDLQRSTKHLRKDKEAAEASATTASTAGATATAAPAAPVDLAKARRTYEEVCSQCHDLSDVDKAPPKTPAESRALIDRMIKDNELTLSAEDSALVAAWLDATYVNK